MLVLKFDTFRLILSFSVAEMDADELNTYRFTRALFWLSRLLCCKPELVDRVTLLLKRGKESPAVMSSRSLLRNDEPWVV